MTWGCELFRSPRFRDLVHKMTMHCLGTPHEECPIVGVATYGSIERCVPMQVTLHRNLRLIIKSKFPPMNP